LLAFDCEEGMLGMRVRFIGKTRMGHVCLEVFPRKVHLINHFLEIREVCTIGIIAQGESGRYTARSLSPRDWNWLVIWQMRVFHIERIAVQRGRVDFPIEWIWKMSDEIAIAVAAAGRDSVTPEVETDRVSFQVELASNDCRISEEKGRADPEHTCLPASLGVISCSNKESDEFFIEWNPGFAHESFE
jgi:hypothetical protein